MTTVEQLVMPVIDPLSAYGTARSSIQGTGVVTEDDHADLGLFQVQRQAGESIPQVEHLVEHRISQALDFGNTIANLAVDTSVFPGRRLFRAFDLRFNFLQ